MHGWHAIVELIDTNEIHLWLAHLGDTADRRLLAQYRELLSEEELQKQARFHFERDRHRYLVTRAMVRTVLSKYAEVAPREWTFQVNEYGKPSAASQLTGAGGIDFNVSHTDGLVVLGVTRQRAIGVDVENVRAREAAIEIADRYFAPAEVTALRALPSDRQHLGFFKYWTLKESYIKARGMGLAIALDQFAFEFEDEARIRLAVHPRLGDQPQRWTFWQLQPTQNHLVAICAENISLRDQARLGALRLWR